MMGSMEPRSEQLYQRLVAGEVEATAPETLQQCDLDPRFREAVEEWRKFQALLERAGREKQSLLQEGLAEMTEADAEPALTFAREQTAAGTDGGPRPHRPVPWQWGLVAVAAALVLSGGWIWFTAQDETGRTGPLNVQGSSEAFPIRRATSVEFFQVPIDLPLGGTVQIWVYDLENPNNGVLDSGLLDTRRWLLTDEQRDRLPRRMRWEYVLRNVDGASVSRGAYECEIGE